MFKKLLALMLACLLALPCGLALAEEAETLTCGDYEYTLNDDGSATITKYRGKAETLTVPAELDGHPVTAIGDKAFAGCESLISVSISNGVTSIGEIAFYGCKSLRDITFPNSLTSIGFGAFYVCHSLSSISIPDSLTSISANPFKDSEKLTQISVSPENPTFATIEGVLFEKTTRTLICYPRAFTEESYTVPQGIQAIGDSAFYYCDTLTSVTIPDSITSIGKFAFSHCKSLTSVVIPDSVTFFGDNAFAICPDLTLTVSKGSYAESYAVENGIPYTYPDSMDWLNG